MALACSPALLIADEPTTALDVTIQAQILDLMRDLQETLGTAIILITHDMGVVAENADRVVVMYAGRKVEEAPVEELFSRPRHPYTRGLMSISIRLSGFRRAHRQTSRCPSHRGPRVSARFPVRCGRHETVAGRVLTPRGRRRTPRR